MKIREAILKASDKIDYIDAKILMKYYLNVDENYIIANGYDSFSNKQIHEYFDLVDQVANGYPVQYITNSQEFMGQKFTVNENVLIPQPDTEMSVEICLNKIKEIGKDNIKILDLCTGSGAIAISLKKFLNDENIKADISASDISIEALRTADENAKDILGKDEIKFMVSDLFDEINEKFDIIISNPPYIETDKIRELSKDVQVEPHLALDGGSDGLRFYRNIRFQVENFLNKGGLVILEIGYNQKDAVCELFEGATCVKDLAGNDRVVVWENK